MRISRSFVPILFAALIGYLGWRLTHITPADIIAYQQLRQLAYSELDQDKKQASHQVRKQVQKDLYFTKNGQQEHAKVVCADSNIHWQCDGRKMQMVEEMAQLQGQLTSAEESNNLTAEIGTYYYNENKLSAEAVHFTRETSGRKWQGEAEQLLCCLQQKPYLHAKSFVGNDGTQTLRAQDLTLLNDKWHAYGNVYFESPKVITQSDAATARLGSHNTLEQLKLNGNVRIRTSDGIALNCEQGEYDCISQKGVFQGGARPAQLFKKGESPLHLQAQQIHVQLMPEIQNQELQSLEALENVHIHYGDVESEGEKLTYIAPDSLTLYSISKPCCLTNKQGKVQAAQVALSAADKKMHIRQPSGQVKLPEGGLLNYQANEGIWEAVSTTLHLLGDIRVHHPTLGYLEVDDTLTIQFKEGVVAQAIASGDTTLIHVDEKGQPHTFKNKGRTAADLQSAEILINKHGAEQALFQDALGKIYADRVRIQLQKGEKAIEVVELEGQVKMYNGFATGAATEGILDQFILTDKALYFPQNKLITLAAYPKRKVVFFDRLNNLKISANALNVYRDRETNKDAVEGVGKVRFSFGEGEKTELKRFISQIEGQSK